VMPVFGRWAGSVLWGAVGGRGGVDLASGWNLCIVFPCAEARSTGVGRAGGRKSGGNLQVRGRIGADDPREGASSVEDRGGSEGREPGGTARRGGVDTDRPERLR
jgi:hypothetical protein